MTTVSLSTVQVTRLIDLLTVTAAGADDEDRHQLDHCREQVGELMAPIEVLVLAGVLREMTERPGPDPIAREGCRRWSTCLARRLSHHADRGVSPVVVAF
jgi:hypothetical protein